MRKIYVLEELNRKKQTHLHLLLGANGTELSFSPNDSWHQEQMLRPVHRYTPKQTGVNLNLSTCVNYWARGRVGGAKRPVSQNKEQTSSTPSPAPFTTSFNISACVYVWLCACVFVEFVSVPLVCYYSLTLQFSYTIYVCDKMKSLVFTKVHIPFFIKYLTFCLRIQVLYV